MIFLLLFVLLSIVPVSHHFMMGTGSEENDPEHFKFNKEGILTIDGTVPGISDPIFFDKRNKNKFCARRQYYVFTFCPKNKHDLENKHKDCAEGIIFCYEGQLSPENSRPTYALPNVENEISSKCKHFHGFKVAMHYLKKRTPKDVGSFVYLEVKTSYMQESYYFQLPDSSCIDLFMGSDANLITAVRTIEHDYRVEKPTQVHLNNGSIVGVHYDPNMPYEEFLEGFTKIPEPENFGRYRDAPHLNMLFLDFKTQYPESGIEKSDTSGIRSSDTRSDNSGGGGGNYIEDDEFRFNGMQNEQEGVQEYRNGMLNFTGEKNATGAYARVRAEHALGAGQLSQKLGTVAGLSGAIDDGSVTKYNTMLNEQTITRHHDATSNSEKELLDNNLYDTIKNTYKSLSTDSTMTGKKSFSSQTVGVQRRTIFKWIVKVPAKHVITPMQMQMDCDGAQVKIPWIKFVLTDDGEDQPLVEYE